MPKPKTRQLPIDHHIEIFTYAEIAHETGFEWLLLRRVSRRLGLEQTVYMRSSYGRQSPSSKKVGVRKRNLGRLIKAAAIEKGQPHLREFERSVNGMLDANTYRGASNRDRELKNAADEEEMRKIDELGRKLGL